MTDVTSLVSRFAILLARLCRKEDDLNKVVQLAGKVSHSDMHVNGEAYSMTNRTGCADLVVVFKSCQVPEAVYGAGSMPHMCELHFHHN